LSRTNDPAQDKKIPDASPTKLEDFARRLLAHEGLTGRPGAKRAKPFEVFHRLRVPLGLITGPGGFRLLLSRSLVQAGAEVPWLRALHIRGDGSLEGVEEMEAKLTPEEIALGAVALAVSFIGLIITFIGPTLTLQLLQDVWPKLDEFDF